MGRGVVLLVVCAILLGGAVVMGNRQSPEGDGTVALVASAWEGQAPAAERASQPRTAPAGRSVRLSDGGVVLPVPDGFQAVAGGVEDPAAASSCPSGYDYCLYDAAAGGGAAALAVRLRDDLASDSDCALDPSPGFEGVPPRVTGTGDHVAARFGGLATASAGQVEAAGLRRLRYGGVCYELVARAVAPDGAAAEAAIRGLAALADALTLPDGRSGLWAGGR